jgi:predicted MFS family arabinose efflux permease
VLAALAEGSGYRAAFILATLFAAIAAILSAALLRSDNPTERKESWASPSSTSK